MAIYPLKVTYNPLGQVTDGLVGEDGIETISGFALLTNGFLWGLSDIWVNCESCEPVDWTDCACSETCS